MLTTTNHDRAFTNACRETRASRLAQYLLASLPIASFLIQYLLSIRAGTQQALFHHLTVTFVDWIFVPFNFFVAPIIDWGRGVRLYLIFSISVILNAVTHAFWEYNGLDFGHMISPAGIVLPAGWVHLAFSTLEMVLLVAFVFCRSKGARNIGIVTALATAYFIAIGLAGYSMHHGLTISDTIVAASGLFFVLIYPRLKKENLES
jgi:hypothetical protein